MPSSNFTQVKIRKTTRDLLRQMADAEGRSMSGMLDILVATGQHRRTQAFFTAADFPNKVKAGKARKSKLGARFNGQHTD